MRNKIVIDFAIFEQNNELRILEFVNFYSFHITKSLIFVIKQHNFLYI